MRLPIVLVVAFLLSCSAEPPEAVAPVGDAAPDPVFLEDAELALPAFPEREACSDKGCASCSELHAESPDQPSGVFLVAPEEITQPVLCDMETDGGGWTLIQRTVWEPAETDALMTGYDTWRDEDVGQLEDGAYRLKGRVWPEVAPDAEILLRLVLRSAGATPCAPLLWTGTFEELRVGPDAAILEGVDAPVSMTMSDALSTLDAGPAVSNCVERFDLVPWFYGSCCMTCPAGADIVDDGERHPLAVQYPADTPDLNGNTFGAVCPDGPVLEEGAVFGVDVMEFWLR